MCGIWAVFGSEEDVTVQCQAALTIRHRGPDAFRIENINHFQNCCLGFHRLAIVDDLLGMQPMRLFTHPHIWLMYNGEIYNHRLLCQTHDLQMSTGCDGESMIHLYHKLGPEAMAAQLDGTFAFCILDTVNRTVALGRDTFGVRPLFRLHTDTGFLAVCSEGKGLIGLSRSISDEDAQIEQFPPGHVEVYHLDQQGRTSLKSRKTFNRPGQAPVYKTLVSPDAGNMKKNIRDLLTAAVKKRLMSERRVGCLLSGGLDSSLVAALLVKLSKEMGITYSIQSFCIGMENSPDLKAARKVSKYLGTEHHEVIFTAQEAEDVIPDVIHHMEMFDTISIRPSIPMYLVSRYIKQNTDTTVIFSGEGSDELTQGYVNFHKAPSSEEADKESRRLLNDLYMYDVLRCDRMPAAWGLEVRVPFLDHQFTSYYLSLSPEQRFSRNGIEKHLLRSAFDDGHLLPNDILWRPKECFGDGVSNFTKPLSQVLQEFCNKQIDDKELAAAKGKYSHLTPLTKEALYYRQLFEAKFPNKASWTPYFWMPRWCIDKNPSVRYIKHYRQ